MITIRFFGGASLEDGHGALTGPAAQRHRLALLALLAVAQPRGLARDRLAGWLWPDRDTAHARNLLNQAVHVLRRTLGESAIVSVGDELRLDCAAVDCDLVALEAALANGEPRRAVELYAGPFLESFSLPDAPEFEQWADGERERLRRGYCRALESLARQAGVDDPPLAAEFWRRLAAEEPYNGQITLRLMAALDAAGDRAGAIRQAQLHALLIREEFDAEPDPQVMQFAERLRAGRPASMPAMPAGGDAAAAQQLLPARYAAAGLSHGAAEPAMIAAASGTAGRLNASVRTTAAATDQPVEPTAPGTPAARRRQHAAVAGIGAITVLALLLAGWLAVKLSAPTPAEIRRVAVLPLANLTGDAQQDHFVAALHDALVAELAKVEMLTVYSRQSVLRYAGSDLPVPAIARELGADALVEGSVFMSGDSMRITAQLVRAHPEAHVWSTVHHGPVNRAFALQGEVARAVARATRVRIDPTAPPVVMRERDPAAQQAYVTGLYHLERAVYGPLLPAPQRRAELHAAREWLERAVGLDTAWATAHAKLALTLHWLASGGFAVEYEAEFYPKSKAAALRAIALDESEAQAHASLGFVLFTYEWDWAGADRAIRRALELDRNSHHSVYALYLNAAGRHDQAITHFLMAQERNPLSEILQIQTANAYACAGRHEEAIERIDALSRRLSPDEAHPAGSVARAGPSDLRALVYSMAGRHAQAVAQAEEAVLLSDSLPGALTNLAFVLARAGRLTEARSLARQLEARAAESGTPWRPAHLYASLGDTTRALAMAEAMVAGRRTSLTFFRCQIVYRLLHDEPRMQQLVRPAGFPH